MIRWFLLIVLLLSAGCDRATPQNAYPLTGNAIRIEAARALSAQATFNGVVYLDIINPTETADRLLAASTAVASSVELHESSQENGVMRMRPRPEGFEIPAQSVVGLVTGGKHMMLVNLHAALISGETFELTLVFQNAGEIVVPVSVFHGDGSEMKMDHSLAESK